MSTPWGTLEVSDPPRGGAPQPALTLEIQSINYSWSWGAQPASGTVTYVGADMSVGLSAGAFAALSVFGLTFYGIVRTDVLTRSSRGNVRTLEYVDLRKFLEADTVFGCFNKLDVRVVNGKRVRRYWHILPADVARHRRTFTNTPYSAIAILNMVFNAPTVGTAWLRFYHSAQTYPVYDIDALNGVKLGSLVQDLTSRQGLVLTLAANTPYKLIWARKGEGPLPLPVESDGVTLIFPAAADECRQGTSLTENPTRLRVVGDRNLYQILNVPMTPDWNRNWEEFWDQGFLTDYIYQNFRTVAAVVGVPAGTRYNAVANDDEHIIGGQLALARSLEITVGEFAALRAAIDGKDFNDKRLFAGRFRSDLPAALYLSAVLFKAFRPPTLITLPEYTAELRSLTLTQDVLAQITIAPAATYPMGYALTAPIDGGSYAVVRGYQVGDDAFRLVSPDRFDLAQWKAAQDLWSIMNYSIDQSGEDGGFILFDQPVIRTSDLFTLVDGVAVPNAKPVFGNPPCLACLTFEAEPFHYVKAGPATVNGHVDAVESIGGLRRELIYDLPTGTWIEVPFADGLLAGQKADAAAAVLLLRQNVYLQGGWKEVLTPATLLPEISGTLDRVTVQMGAQGKFADLDFTTERGRNAFEPARDYDHRLASQAAFSGQVELRQQANDARRLAAALKQDRKSYKNLTEAFGDTGEPRVRINTATPAGELKAGTPLWKLPVTIAPGQTNTNTLVTDPDSVDALDSVFVGVSVRTSETLGNLIPVKSLGQFYARVKGPVAVNDPVGQSTTATDRCLVSGGTPSVGLAMQTIPDATIKLIRVVRTGGGGGDGAPVWL